jgi:predicted alpha/beta-fold hydrolase
VRLAVADLDRRFPARPLHLVGYSNGAALALQHALSAIEDDTLRGERGVLQIDDSAMLRQRWNPFHPYLKERMLAFLGLSP